jgi:transcriptional regulator with XRE-family HTH domain
MEIDSIGKRIRKRRKDLKLTLNQVAKGSGLSTGTISDLEQGRQDSTSRLHHIADFLRVSVAWLETGREAQQPSDRLASSRISEVSTLPYHGHQLTEEAARFAAEWMKMDIKGRAAISSIVEMLVGKQIRDGRTPRGGPPPNERSNA